MANITISVPALFWHDHRARALSPTAVVVKTGERLVTVTLDDEAWDDLYGDAYHYSVQDFDVELGGLVRSAKATLRRMSNTQREETN